jgi:hypothetical protein
MSLLAVLRPVIGGIFFLHQLITSVIYPTSWVGLLAYSSHPDDHFTPIGYRGLRPMGGFFFLCIDTLPGVDQIK